MSKYALLIGINYTGSDMELNGCINDVKKIKDVLITKFSYPEENIILMTDDSESDLLKPTALNIMNQLGSLIIKAYHKKAKEIWVHYSGHGTYRIDKSGDESDGKDEVIVPIDYDKSGLISDDLLHNYLEYLPEETNVFCLFDCCHSGSILDLKHIYLGNDQYHSENPNSKIKGNIIMISGCKDDQTSADALIKSNWSGAMTSAFLESLKNTNYQITYYYLLESMRKYLISNKYLQIPQLSSSKRLSPVSIFCAKNKIEPSLYVTSN